MNFTKRKIGFLVVAILICLSLGALASCGAQIEGVSFTDMTVEYDGTEKAIEVAGLPSGATVTYSPANVFKDAGVYTVTATVKQDGFNDKVMTANLTVTPKVVTVTYDKNIEFKGSGEAPESVPYTVNGVVEGDTVELEFDFGDCEFEEGDKGTFIASSKNPNYTLKASSQKKDFTVGAFKHTVKYETGVEGVTLEDEKADDSKTIREPRLVNQGYELIGWFNGEEQWNFTSDRVKGDMTLTAKWKAIDYKIFYFMNGGTNSAKNPATFTVENEAVLYAPEKEGAIFLGWYKDRELTEPMTEIKPRTYVQNVRVYAKWTSAPYSEMITGDTVDATFIRESSLVNGSFRYTFAANVESFDENGVIYIGRGKDAVSGSYIAVTATKIIAYSNTATGLAQVGSINHGRLIKGFVTVDVSIENGKATIVLNTVNGKSDATFNFTTRNGEIFASSENCVLTDATFGWSTDAYNELVWILGDSNIGNTLDKNWTKSLTDAGFYALMMGADGVDSTGVLAAFEAELVNLKPKYAIWSFAKESGETYNQNLQRFITVCKTNNIVPVLTTQLVADAAENAAKNEAVKASGERYIDFAALEAFGGVIDGGKYTEEGAKAMYAKLLVDFPEIISPEVEIRTESANTLDGTTGSLLLDDGRNNRVRDGKHLVFNAKINGTLPKDAVIGVGHGEYPTLYTNWIEITSTHILFYSVGGNRPDELKVAKSFEHGLEIKNYITVIISSDDDQQGDAITVITDGDSYSFKRGWSASNGAVFARANGVTLTDATMHWTCVDYDKDIWLIGASYFTLGDPARWLYYLYADGLDDNIYVAGRGGLDGPGGIDELKDALRSGFVPKAIAWGIGMNDGSDPGDIKPAYYNSLLELMQICKENDIMLYIMTIPNTPKQDNSYKLSYVLEKRGEFKNYDYRVVDIARAIDAHEVGSSWYEGMIHSDQTHPTALGARAFYLQFLCDFPELMVGGSAAREELERELLSIGSSATISTNGKHTYDSAITLSADTASVFNGKITLGTGYGVEGGSYITVEKDMIRAYTVENGEAVLLAEVKNTLDMKDIVNIAIHIEGNTAKISLMSADDNMEENKVFSFETYWSNAGDVFVTAETQALSNVNLKWVTKG